MNVIEFDNISKQYRLGLVSTRTFSHDLNRWWAMNVLGREDPYLKIGETNDRSHKGHSDYVWALKDIKFSIVNPSSSYFPPFSIVPKYRFSNITEIIKTY